MKSLWNREILLVLDYDCDPSSDNYNCYIYCNIFIDRITIVKYLSMIIHNGHSPVLVYDHMNTVEKWNDDLEMKCDHLLISQSNSLAFSLAWIKRAMSCYLIHKLTIVTVFFFFFFIFLFLPLIQNWLFYDVCFFLFYRTKQIKIFYWVAYENYT